MRTAKSVGEWTAACFLTGDVTSESELRELIQEAADAARNDFDSTSANQWAEGYRFPAEHVASATMTMVTGALPYRTCRHGRGNIETNQARSRCLHRNLGTAQHESSV